MPGTAMEKEGFECKRCGECCLRTEHADICDEDIKNWKEKGRDDLYTKEMLIEWDYFGASGLFKNQNTSICPFLRKVKGKKAYYCKINDMKPIFCRQFPKDKKQGKDFCNCSAYG